MGFVAIYVSEEFQCDGVRGGGGVGVGLGGGMVVRFNMKTPP